MARTVTIQISDRDYEDLVNHLAKDSIGRPLVAVIADASASGSYLKRDVEQRKYELLKAEHDAQKEAF